MVTRVVSALNLVSPVAPLAHMINLFTTIMEAVEAELPPPPRRRRKRGWWQLAETSAAFKIAGAVREDARQSLARTSMESVAWKTLRTACANLREVIVSGLHAYFEEYLAESERLLAGDDQRGCYEHLKSTTGLEGKNARSEQFIMDEMARCAAVAFTASLNCYLGQSIEIGEYFNLWLLLLWSTKDTVAVAKTSDS